MIKTYYLLTKPGIIAGNLITTTAAFLLGSRGSFSAFLFLMTAFGLGCVIASACVINNCIDRDADAKMQRTQNRALAKKELSLQNAALFAILLMLIGSFILATYTNIWALASSWAGFFIYVVLYSLGKYRTMYATFIGSVAGAIPPVVGYSSATGQLDLGAFLFFSLLVFWQMPHFFAISVYRMQEYAAASIPVISRKIGIYAIKKQTLVYIFLFLLSLWMLFACGYTSYFCMMGNLLFGLFWLKTAIAFFKTDQDIKYAKQVFGVSLIAILAISLLISVDSLFFYI